VRKQTIEKQDEGGPSPELGHVSILISDFLISRAVRK
jgi:hypothetical protein